MNTSEFVLLFLLALVALLFVIGGLLKLHYLNNVSQYDVQDKASDTESNIRYLDDTVQQRRESNGDF
jgi:hypothetical protein